MLQRSLSAPVLCHNLAHEDSDHLSVPQDITLDHDIDDITVTGASEHKVATTLDKLVKHMHIRGLELNTTQRAFYFAEILGGPVV